MVTSRVFVDDYSGALGVYFLKNKSDAVRATEQSDNGGEYISEEFKSVLLKNHNHEFSAPYSPIKMEQLKEPVFVRGANKETCFGSSSFSTPVLFLKLDSTVTSQVHWD